MQASVSPQRWMVVANCQTYGIARSIACLARGVECSHYDIWQFEKLIEQGEDGFADRYDLALISTEVRNRIPLPDHALPPQIIFPNIAFSAFHPDCCYVTVHGEVLEGVIGPYHSMIALAAYKEGLSAQEAAGWFNAATYERAGYLDMWVPQRDLLISQFPPEWNIGAAFLKWARSGCFMHTINHPKIEMIFEMSRSILLGIGQPIFEGAAPPPEYLADPAWPIYPEIGERLGLPGAYLFKPMGKDSPLELLPYLERSLAVFAQWDRSVLKIQLELQPRLQGVRRMMRGEA